MAGSNIVKRVIFLVAMVVAAWAGYLAFDAYRTASKLGFLEKREERTYIGSTDENLKALATALNAVQESDGQYPAGDKWMDAIMPRIQPDDMKKEEADKKLQDPAAKPGTYGFALNDAVAGKYKGDIKNPDTTPLLFQTTLSGKNQHGDPSKVADKAPRNHAISISGKLITLKSN